MDWQDLKLNHARLEGSIHDWVSWCSRALAAAAADPVPSVVAAAADPASVDSALYRCVVWYACVRTSRTRPHLADTPRACAYSGLPTAMGPWCRRGCRPSRRCQTNCRRRSTLMVPLPVG